MNEAEQRGLLEALTSDIGKRVGCRVFLKRWDKEGRRFSLRVSVPATGDERAFGFATIRPLKGCLGLTTWEKCLRDVDPDTLPHWHLVDNLEFRSPLGQKCWYCEASREAYDEAVNAMEIACMHYLRQADGQP